VGVGECTRDRSESGTSANISESEFFRRAAARGAAIGTLFLAFFGSAWLFIGLASLPRQLPWLYAVLALPPLCLLGAAVGRLRVTSGKAPEEYRGIKKRIGRQLGIVNAVQWTAIIIIAAVLSKTGRGALIVPAIVAVVALHFIPLARVFRDSLFYWVCPAMILWVVLCYQFSVSSTDIRLSAMAIGTGAILWTTSALDLWKSRQLPRGF